MLDLKITKNYLKERGRMTKCCNNVQNCLKCALSQKNNRMNLPCEEFESQYPDQAIELLQRWSESHPKKTYLTEFLKYYPNASFDEVTGLPDLCLISLGVKKDCSTDCKECWNTLIEESE